MDSSQRGENTLPVFVINNQLPAFDQKLFTTTELCTAAEKVCGFNTIEGAQRIGGLWRIYPLKKEARQTLILKGIVLRGVSVSVKTTNPYLLRNPDTDDPAGDKYADQPPSTKLIIGNIPLSVSDELLLQSVKQLGVTIMSKLIAEKDRDEMGKLTHWKTGRRFVYIAVPKEPLPRNVQIDRFRASLYHREQKLAERQKESECRRCLAKGHRVTECTAPIKCRQCLGDGHKMGESVCPLVPKGCDNTEKTDKRDDSRLPASREKNERNNKQSSHKAAKRRSNERDTSTSTHSRKDSREDHSRSTEDSDTSRSRPRTRKHQTKLTSFRRENSGSVKRPRSSEADCPKEGKQRKVREPGDETEGSDEDEEFLQCETAHSQEWC